MEHGYYPTDEEHFFNFLLQKENDRNEKKPLLEEFKEYYAERDTRERPNDIPLSTFVSMGLVIIITIGPDPKEYIKKTEEFHRANHLTWGTWFEEYRDKKHLDDWFRHRRAIAAKFWWLPIVISIIALIISIFTFFGKNA
ncbi:MAG TPA: hypothetical protein VFD35_12090 [Pricia sp.]|nr:hypothetical protein [Pricia sp.]